MTDSWQQIFATYPFLRTVFDAICIAVPMSCMLAFAGIIFISAIAKIISIARGRPSFDKCARQLALLGLILGWSLLIGSRIWLYYTQQEHVPGSLENFMLEMSWMLLSLGVLLSSVYFTLWRILKNMPVLHSTLGMISAVQNCLTLVSVLFTCRLAAASALPQDSEVLPNLFPNVWNAPVWTAACYTVPLIFALASAFGCVWMALRRKHDDFGRDYYNQMLCWCARWARNAWLVLWILLFTATSIDIWTHYQQGAFDEQAAISESCRLLFWLLPMLLWAIFIRVRIPLRQRWTLYLALPLAVAFMLPYYLDITSM